MFSKNFFKLMLITEVKKAVKERDTSVTACWQYAALWDVVPLLFDLSETTVLFCIANFSSQYTTVEMNATDSLTVR
jgi:hypothetical protein